MSVPSYIKLSPQMDMATLINALNQNFNQIQSQDRRKVITDEDGFDRIVLGKQENGSYAIKVSEDGKDANTATDDELVMSSDWQMWKIINSSANTHTGQYVFLDVDECRRNGNITLNGTYIGYVSIVNIPIPNVNFSNAAGFIGRMQIFVRNWTTKNLLDYHSTIFNDGTNMFEVNHTFYRGANTENLVLQTIIRRVAGSWTFAPRSEAILPPLYWDIANPTRTPIGGMGGGGTPTGSYIYIDEVDYDYQTNTYSNFNSFTGQFADSATSNRFPYNSLYNFPDIA